jgi:murein DD-endopeptidase MepM/ murein hydrolase activator NlpD
MRLLATLLCLLLVVLLVPPAGATVEAADVARAEQVLDRVAAALEREAARLERLLTGPRLAGVDGLAYLQSYLFDLDIRLAERRLEANEAAGALLSSAVIDRVDADAGIRDHIPGLGMTAVDSEDVARLRPVLQHWVGYRQALDRVLELRIRLRFALAPQELIPGGRVCPIPGDRDFEDTWGEDRPWGRTHKGQDMHAEMGSDLVAIESGTIVQSGWHWAGGFGVYLEGAYTGDVYYYAHLSWIPESIGPGVAVEVGDLVGWVGMTGNAESPHLHLGWIPNNRGPWVDLEGLADPYPLLVAICG